MEPQPSDNSENNQSQYFYAAPGYANYPVNETQGHYPPQYAKPAEDPYAQSPAGYNPHYMGPPNDMMNSMHNQAQPGMQPTEMYGYQYPEGEQMPFQPSMPPAQQYVQNVNPQYSNNQFANYGHEGMLAQPLVPKDPLSLDAASKAVSMPVRLNAGSPGSPMMARQQQEIPQDFSTGLGFAQDFSMQNLEEEHKDEPDSPDEFDQFHKNIASELSSKESEEKETKNVIKLQKMGEKRVRRKSSTLDMLEPDNFLKEVEEQIEKVKDQNTTESGSEEISSKNSKRGSQINSLRSSLRGKKVCAPYRPSNYQNTHLSPSPKRMMPLNSPPLRNMRSGTFYSNQGQPKQSDNLEYEDQESFGFALQLNRTEAETPVGGPTFQRTYSHSMKYNDPSRIQNYHHGGAHQQMQPSMGHQNMHGSSFRQNHGYSHYERDTYSPDVNRRSYMEAQEMGRFSHHNPPMMQEGWQGYNQSHMQPQMYPNPTQVRQSAPERSMKLRTDSSRSSIDMNSVSQGEDMEAKSLSNFEEGPNGYNVDSPELVEKAYDFAKDQAGCRLLQKKIMDGSQEAIDEIYEKILPKFVELMNNPFGNYLCQKITEAVDESKLKLIIEEIKQEVFSICCNAHGTRAIQKIIECAKSRELIEMIIDLLKDDVQELVEDINGNHVIQKILFTFKAPDNEFIFEAMIDKCREIA